MSKLQRRQGSLRAAVLWPLRMLYKGTLFLILAFMMAPARALSMTPKIDKPEKKNRITQVEEK